jgi:oxalate decarboxylase
MTRRNDLSRNRRKTGAGSGAPTQEPTSSFSAWWRAAAPFALSRRNLFGATAGLAGLAAALPAATEKESWGRTSETDPGGNDPLGNNPALLPQNEDSWMPPRTDRGDIRNFKFSFTEAHNRRSNGGWAREITVRDFPISTSMAGVNMRLAKGAVRELHWHIPAEWAYMLYGEARITGVDPHGRGFVSDVGVGDLWYFPTGIPHSIQGLGNDGCEFLLVFDDGAFSEFSTFQITEWMAHTPRQILAQNFQLPVSTFNRIPPEELYIFPAPMPNPLDEDIKAAERNGPVPERYDYHMLAQTPNKRTKGGEVRIVDSNNFKVSKTIASALVTLRRGGLRELHWHPRADEWQYFIKGKGRMTIFASGHAARTMDFQKGDVGYVPRSMAHYIVNTGDEDLEFLEMFRDSEYQDISLSNWMANVPPELVTAHLGISEKALRELPKEKSVVLPL